MQTGLIIFAGPGSSDPAERLVEDARSAALFDLLDTVREADCFSPVVVVTDLPDVRGRLPSWVVTEPAGPDFHFGRRLREVVHAYEMDAVAVASAGCAPLFQAADLLALAREGSVPGTVVSNNMFSADILAFCPASALDRVPLPARDNHLASSLRLDGGLVGKELPRTAATQLDIDTPTELLILAVHPATPPHLRAYLEGLDLDISPVRRLGRVLTDPLRQLVVAGRVGSHAWSYLERQTACRVRLFSEERGMEADGRADRGEARSLLGYYAQEMGMHRLFEALADLGDGVILDSRVLLAHVNRVPSRADRFLSDMGRWADVQDPFLRELTYEAVHARVPVLMGGHSLVSGGLMALTEAAWLIADKEKAAS